MPQIIKKLNQNQDRKIQQQTAPLLMRHKSPNKPTWGIENTNVVINHEVPLMKLGWKGKGEAPEN